MDIQRSNHSELRNFYAVVNHLQEMNWDALLFLSQQQDSLVVVRRHRWDLDFVKRDARGSLF